MLDYILFEGCLMFVGGKLEDFKRFLKIVKWNFFVGIFCE